MNNLLRSVYPAAIARLLGDDYIGWLADLPDEMIYDQIPQSALETIYQRAYRILVTRQDVDAALAMVRREVALIRGDRDAIVSGLPIVQPKPG